MKILGPTTSLPLLLLAQLVACDPEGFDSGDEGVHICHFCRHQFEYISKGGWKYEHEAGCPYIAAKEFVEPFMIEVEEPANA